jgi:dTDP-4-dehydrorhamnose reductase
MNSKTVSSSMRKIVVTGAKGQLGSRLAESQNEGLQVVALDRSVLDLASPNSIHQALDQYEPDLVINAAAYTAVDRAEEEVDRAFLVNATGTNSLARACAERGVDLIHVSTDYVFDGTSTRPYRPEDPPNPIGAYARSKREGERFVEQAYDQTTSRWWVVRVAWLCDVRGHNFMQTMLRLGREGKSLRVVDDQHGAPTLARPFAQALLELAANPESVPSGIWHYSPEGITTWNGFAAAIFDLHGLEVNLAPCTTDAYPTPAKRPAYSYLDGSEFARALGVPQQHWREALAIEINQLNQEN